MYRGMPDSYPEFSGGITHHEEEQTEFVSLPTEDPQYSPNESIDAFRPMTTTSTPKLRTNRITRTQSLCLYDDEKSIHASPSTDESRVRDLEAQIAHLKSKLSQQDAQLKQYDEHISGLEEVGMKYSALQSTVHKLREENNHYAAQVKKAEAAITNLQSEKMDVERMLEAERRKLAATLEDMKLKDELLRESEHRVTEVEMSFSAQLQQAEAQLEVMSQSVTDLDRTRLNAQSELVDIKQQLSKEIERLEEAHRRDVLALKEQCAQREAALALRIKDLELAQRDPVLATGFELTRDPPTPQNSILEELMQAIPSNVQEDLRERVKSIENDNAQLRLYIDSLLMRIIERYPQILEK